MGYHLVDRVRSAFGVLADAGIPRRNDIDQEEARALFHLLDVEETGEIDAELIVASCMRLHGHAKAIELAAFMHEYRRSQKAWMARADHIEKTLGRICKAVNAQPHHQRAAGSP